MHVYMQFSSKDIEFSISKADESIVSFIMQTIGGDASMSIELSKDELELLNEWIDKQLDNIK